MAEDLQPLRVCVTGAAGQIAYSLLYSLGSGQVFGPDQRMELLLLDIPPMLPALEGVVMEINDCALDLVTSVVATADVKTAFTDLDVAFLIGSMPRREGMERKDLLKANAKIFETQGGALDQYAKKTVKVLVVGNPANTNCLIASRCAPSIPAGNFTCLTRLDQNRAQTQIASRIGVSPKDVQDVIIWGNHSSTQFPDVDHAKVTYQGQVLSVREVVKDDHFLNRQFIQTVQTRGAAVIKARKLSSAMSAAKAICDHMRDWWFGTGDRIVSMGVVSCGDYNIPENIVYSYPIRVSKDRECVVVQGLEISDFAREKMDITATELQEEQVIATSFLANN